MLSYLNYISLIFACILTSRSIFFFLGLHFDIERQTCDWRNRVHNCDEVARPELAKPNFKTDKPVCPHEHLQCGDGQCLAKSVFCDGNIDCHDGSDENACTLEEDPNASPECDLKKCKLPECFCTDRHDDEFVVNPFAGKLTIDQVKTVNSVFVFFSVRIKFSYLFTWEHFNINLFF